MERGSPWSSDEDDAEEWRSESNADVVAMVTNAGRPIVWVNALGPGSTSGSYVRNWLAFHVAVGTPFAVLYVAEYLQTDEWKSTLAHTEQVTLEEIAAIRAAIEALSVVPKPSPSLEPEIIHIRISTLRLVAAVHLLTGATLGIVFTWLVRCLVNYVRRRRAVSLQ